MLAPIPAFAQVDGLFAYTSSPTRSVFIVQPMQAEHATSLLAAYEWPLHFHGGIKRVPTHLLPVLGHFRQTVALADVHQIQNVLQPINAGTQRPMQRHEWNEVKGHALGRPFSTAKTDRHFLQRMQRTDNATVRLRRAHCSLRGAVHLTLHACHVGSQV